MVANLSIAGPKSETVNKAVDAAVDAGVVVIVAAGNQGSDACQGYSPASASKAITVGSSEHGDRMLWLRRERRAAFSN